MDEQLGSVYFIAEKNNPDSDIKIGFSKSVSDRVFALQTGNSKELKIKYIIEAVPISFETYMHGICSRYRKQGQWFDKDVMPFLLVNNSPWFKKNIVRYIEA